MVQAMSEEQLKAAETEATAQVEEGVEEISEEDLGGVAGGVTPVAGGGVTYSGRGPVGLYPPTPLD